VIVVDASAVLELLLGTERAERVAARVFAPNERLDAPHLLDIEVGQALRRLAQLNAITVLRADEALADFASLVIERHAHRELLPRIWQLRDSLTAYDAAYVALAEALDAPVLTCDAKLGRAHGHRARIEVVS
jgi:predicted nucleic acid-binding protein